jgi:hypothetical protein
MGSGIWASSGTGSSRFGRSSIISSQHLNDGEDAPATVHLPSTWRPGKQTTRRDATRRTEIRPAQFSTRMAQCAQHLHSAIDLGLHAASGRYPTQTEPDLLLRAGQTFLCNLMCTATSLHCAVHCCGVPTQRLSSGTIIFRATSIDTHSFRTRFCSCEYANLDEYLVQRGTDAEVRGSLPVYWGF